MTAALFAVGGLTACGGAASDAPTYAGVVRETPLNVADVTLRDVTDEATRGQGIVEDGELRMRADDGRLLLVYYGFTNCPDVCPTTLADLRVALRDLTPSERERIDVAFATVDPDRDTEEVMNAYTGHFFDTYHVLRDTAQDVEAAAERFLAKFDIEEVDGEIVVSHTAVLYAVDERGDIRIEWPFGTSGQAMGEDLRTLLATLGAAGDA
jgi:protein SCO1/2